MPERHTSPATDHTVSQRPDSKPETEQEKKSWLDLSPVQVMGGALAAMTAAGLGSRFSVEGTLVGAALASVIAAVASALYTASLRRTTVAVRGVLGGRRSRAGGSSAPRPAPHGSTAAAPQPHSAGAPARTSRRRALVLSSVVGAVAIFGLTGVALTMYEAIAGRALSGGSGTTFSQVQRGDSDNRSTDEPSATPTGSAEPSESADPTPSAEASETPEDESAPTAEPSAEPSVAPSAEPSATAEAEPSATAEAPSLAPSEADQTPR